MPERGALLRIAGVSLVAYAVVEVAFWLAALTVGLGAPLAALAIPFVVAGLSLLGLSVWGLLRIVQAALAGASGTPYLQRVQSAVLTLSALCVGPAVAGLVARTGVPVWSDQMVGAVPAILVPGALILLVVLPLVRPPT